MNNKLNIKIAFFDIDGTLTVLEPIDFTIKRVFWIYNVPCLSVRANHACMNASTVFIATSGAVTVATETIDEKKCYYLDKNNIVLFVEPGTWIKAYDFSRDAVLMCFSDKKYEDCVYINNYDEYLMIKNRERLED